MGRKMKTTELFYFFIFIATRSIVANNNVYLTDSRLQHKDDVYPRWLPISDRKLLNGGEGRSDDIKIDVIVAKDGSGQFNTISEAIAAYMPPKNNESKRYVVYVKAGIYEEQVVIRNDQPNLFIYGDGSTKTIVTNNISHCPNNISTEFTATFSANGANFMAKRIGFRNTAGWEGHQAVALMTMGDKSIVYECNIEGFQDTLFVRSGRQFFRDCVISGTVDFIFGNSKTVIQNSLIIVRLGGPTQKNTVTADGNDKINQLSGIVIQNCRIIPDDKLAVAKLTTESYLGRPWKKYSTTVFIDTEIGDFIHPKGWLIWKGTTNHQTCQYKEFRNKGLGASPNTRVTWIEMVTDPQKIIQFTVDNFLNLTNDPW